MTESQGPAAGIGAGPADPPVRIRRPLRLGDLIEAVGKIYRRHWRAFVGLATIVQLPAFLAVVALLPAVDAPLQRATAAGTPSLDDARTLTLFGLALVAVSHASSVLLGGLLTAAVAELDRNGDRPIAAALGLWLRRLPSLLVAGALSGVALLAVLMGALVLLAVATLVGPAGGPIAFLVVVLAVAVLAALALALTRWALLAPAAVYEALGPIAVLRRSWQLVRGSTWRVLGIGVLVTFAILVVTRTLVELAGIVLSVVDPLAPGVRGPGSLIFSGLVQLAVAPILPLTYAYLFDDLAARPAGRT